MYFVGPYELEQELVCITRVVGSLSKHQQTPRWDASHKLLKLIPDCRIEEIESGCCGMAGSFGYEKEHYELSIKLAEMSLAPAVRGASEETIICASGTSCRDQIEHTTGRRAIHPIEVFADALIVN